MNGTLLCTRKMSPMGMCILVLNVYQCTWPIKRFLIVEGSDKNVKSGTFQS